MTELGLEAVPREPLGADAVAAHISEAPQLVLRAIVDASLRVAAVFDAGGTLVRASLGLAELLGSGPKALVERPLGAILPPEMCEPLARVLCGETLTTEHAFVRGREGAPSSWLRATWLPVIQPGGHVIGGVLMAADITAEKNEARFSTLIETSPIAISWATLDGRIIYESQASAAMFGYASSEEMIAALNGGDGAVALYDEPRARRELVSAARIADGRWVVRQLRFRRRDGGVFTALAHYCVRQDVVTGDARLFSFLQDVTTEAHAREELEKSLSLLQEAERLAELGCWEWDVETGALWTSKGWQEIHGLSRGPESMAQLTPDGHPDEYGTIAAMMLSSRTRTGRAKMQHRIVRRDTGEVRRMEIHAEPMLDGEGRAVRLRGLSLDVTERVRAIDELREREQRLQSALGATVAALSATVEMRDPYTAGHERRAAELACAIARRLGWGEGTLETLRTSALIHDIGKIAIPAEILSKPGRLTPMEFQLIKSHPDIAHDILAPIDFGAPVAEIVRQHHERLDGSGYPRGLEGDEILPEARIIAIADVVEAMISHRPYRPALPLPAVVAELAGGRGAWYDPEAADACLSLLEEGFSFSDD